MFQLVALFALAVIVPSDQGVPASPDVCETLNKGLDQNMKEAAEHKYVLPKKITPQGLLLAELQIANELAKAKMNLMLMRENQCPLPTEPVNPDKYQDSAISCWAALEKIDFKYWKKDIPEECDMEKWSVNLIDLPDDVPPTTDIAPLDVPQP
jgi:hypothetical protein